MSRFGFFSLLPTEVLEQIDTVVSVEVTPYIKTMGALPQAIQTAAAMAAERESGEMYLGHLAQAWRRHNDLAVELDGFLVNLYTGRQSFAELSTIRQARAFLPRAYQTEDEKRIYSVGVKLALDASIRKAQEKYHLTEEQKTLLLSSWVLDFWTYRLKCHAQYFLETLSGECTNEGEKLLAETFHAGESILLRSRLRQILGENHLTKEAAQKIVAQCEGTERKVKSLATAGCYLVMGRPDLRAIQRLVQYDNRVEYLFSCNMFGMPDFFFRKEIVHFLVSTGLLEKRPSIVFYSQQELDDRLKKLEEAYDGEWQQDGSASYATSVLTDNGHHLWRGVHNDGALGPTKNAPH
jgi:hypothetical protein